MTSVSPPPRLCASAPSVRHVAGCMTGTSIDGLDAALVTIHGHGLGMRAAFVRGISIPLGKLTSPLRKMAEQEPLRAGEIVQLSRDFALLHVRALKKLLGSQAVDLIAVHGQTVFHAPPLSWQLINPAPLAAAFGVPVVSDLRAADLACGGQGAPITPLSDFVLYRASETRGIVNLGGFCNVTRLPACTQRRQGPDGHTTNGISGGDVCVCNQLLDTLARELFGAPYDAGGARAARGKLRERPFAALCAELARQARGARALGTGDETSAWLKTFRGGVDGCDLARCACAAIAETLVRYCGALDCLILAGGGVHNDTLVQEIRRRATGRKAVKVVLSNELGVPVEFREAAGMAVLGALCQDRQPITLPRVTGVKRAPVSGLWVLP